MLFAYLLLGAQAATPAVLPAAAPAARADPMVCRYQTATGSIFPGRICKARSQWMSVDRE
ncbi:hypothetical protein [Sphingomonas sp.]|uniref:hypothetical protein n=1 Tax=Sphingomonas sp. TaxID=28214 RepID=UPI003CC61C7D